MSKKRVLIFASCFLVLISIVVLAILNYENLERDKLYESIIQLIQKYDRGESKCIDLGNIDLINWDKVYIFGPYSYPEDIDARLGTYWRGSRFSQIKYSDAITLLVFVDKGRVRQYVEFYKGDGDFSGNKTGLFFSKNEAKFKKNDLGEISQKYCDNDDCCNE